MLVQVNPKLPMRDKNKTREFYITELGFQIIGTEDYEGYLILGKDQVQIHFFEFHELVPEKNYGQVYIRTNGIDQVYESFIRRGISIHPNGHLEAKPWGQKEFSLLDPDHNLLTFGEAI